MKKIVRVVLWTAGGLVASAALTAGGYVLNNVTYFDRAMAAVWRADFVEKQVTVEGNALNDAEGPENGLPLLLIHGQAVDWKHYARILPDLADHYHVFAVDCYGHGGSARTPETYSNVAMGADLALFIEDVIGEPAVVSGHSSGGLPGWLPTAPNSSAAWSWRICPFSPPRCRGNSSGFWSSSRSGWESEGRYAAPEIEAHHSVGRGHRVAGRRVPEPDRRTIHAIRMPRK